MKRTETLRQAQTCVEEKGARILPTGKISRDAMRNNILRQFRHDAYGYFQKAKDTLFNSVDAL